MEPTGVPPSRKQNTPPCGLGELILQSGRHSGTSRPLGTPLTFVGRAPGCDVRLNIDGVNSLHCLLVRGPDGVAIRDLESNTGTWVNGKRVNHVSVHDGDTVNVGPCQFRLRLPTGASAEAASAPRDSVRLQSAAVAAQQVALAEEEEKLVQRRAALESQEAQLAAHLEGKRLKLLQLSERAQADRAAIETDRAAYQEYIAKVTGDLTAPQRELIGNQHKVDVERKRLAALQRRIRQRWHRFWLAERHKVDERGAALAAQTRGLEDQAARLQGREEELAAKRLRFQTLYELGRCHLRESWQNLRQEQFRWKHRRGKERAALKVRERDVDAAGQRLLEAQRLFIKEKRTWDSTRTVLQAEAEGVETRVRNQRQKLVEQQNEIARLDSALVTARGEGRAARGEAEAKEAANPPEDWRMRFQHLEQLAGGLADQRAQLLEQWQCLSNLHEHWDKDRQAAARELEQVAGRLMENGQRLAQRRQTGLQADQLLRQRHDDLVQLRQQMIAWRARLCVREKSWEGERQRLLLEVRNREELADQHLNTLVDLRQRWAGHRREELEKLQREHQAMAAAHNEHSQQRLLLAEQTTTLEADKRILAERALALEQYREELLSKVATPSAERRLERLRRRWITVNATAIRAATRERESLKALLLTLEARHAELHTKAGTLARAKFDLIEKQTAWEHKQALAMARQARVQQQIQSAEAQRNLSEQQVARMKEEIERIARALIDEPDPPTSEALSEAA